MTGCVYAVTNKAMPGLVKVGHTTNHPRDRAAELNHTGSPHPYVVEYHAHVEHPRAVEADAHALLKDKNEGKEWFRCSVEHAVACIRQAAGERLQAEDYYKFDGQMVGHIRQKQIAIEKEATLRRRVGEARAEALLKKIAAKEAIELEVKTADEGLRQAYEASINEIIIKLKEVNQYYTGRLKPYEAYFFEGYIFGFSLALMFCIIFINEKKYNIFMISLLLGVPLGIWVQGLISNHRRDSSTYSAIVQERDEKVKAMQESLGSIRGKISLLTQTREERVLKKHQATVSSLDTELERKLAEIDRG